MVHISKGYKRLCSVKYEYTLTVQVTDYVGL